MILFKNEEASADGYHARQMVASRALSVSSSI